MYFCWSRQDNNDDELKNITISANTGGHEYDNLELDNIINRPFTARLYINETHLTCHDNEEWSTTIDDNVSVYCPTSTGYYAASFIIHHYSSGYKL